MTPAFLSYLRADGIILPPDNPLPQPSWSDRDSGVFSSAELDSDDEEEDPSSQWQEVHQAIKNVIAELGGKVVPKLNWSAPKDATWISTSNSMECREPNDIYLLLKSSDFITHDLEHAFDDCANEEKPSDESIHTDQALDNLSYHLALRKYFVMNPSVEFRCFVKDRTLIAICQRDSNHYAFLFEIMSDLKEAVQSFYDTNLKQTFPDDNFTFDVYIPSPHQKVWLIDINPWAPRTDALLFSWYELLHTGGSDGKGSPNNLNDEQILTEENEKSGGDYIVFDSAQSESDPEEIPRYPEFRLIRKDDPESYTFNSPKYSAHKMPRDVVDASNSGVGGLREFAQQWEERVAEWEQQRQAGNTSNFFSTPGTHSPSDDSD